MFHLILIFLIINILLIFIKSIKDILISLKIINLTSIIVILFIDVASNIKI